MDAVQYKILQVEDKQLLRKLLQKKIGSIVYVPQNKTGYVYMAFGTSPPLSLARINVDPKRPFLNMLTATKTPLVFYQANIARYLGIDAVPKTWINFNEKACGCLVKYFDKLLYVHKAPAPAHALTLLSFYLRQMVFDKERLIEKIHPYNQSFLKMQLLTAKNLPRCGKAIHASLKEHFPQEVIEQEEAALSKMSEKGERWCKVRCIPH